MFLLVHQVRRALLRNLLIAVIAPMASLLLSPAAIAETSNANIGIVVMHGKGGAPTGHVAELAAALASQGYLVANLEMPWSRKRGYDVNVSAAETEVQSALRALRDRGAQKLFVSGHSQGGLFALYFGSKHVVDGVIAIAPGGNVASPTFRQQLADSVAQAQKLIAEGKGAEKTNLSDYEGSRGTYSVTSAPQVYLTWFDPAGAMNQTTAIRSMNPATPVLFIAPTNDYPGLLKIKQQMFDDLPHNASSRLVEPSSNHVNAPTVSIREIADWILAVSNAR